MGCGTRPSTRGCCWFRRGHGARHFCGPGCRCWGSAWSRRSRSTLRISAGCWGTACSVAGQAATISLRAISRWIRSCTSVRVSSCSARDCGSVWQWPRCSWRQLCVCAAIRDRSESDHAGFEFLAARRNRMKSAKSTGRIVGMLLLIHLTAGLILPFVLLDRVRRPAGFLENAAGNSAQLRAAVFLLFVGSAVTIGIALTAWPVFRRHSSAMALWLLALAVAGFSLQAVDNAHILSMLSLSQEYAKAGA